MGERGAEAAITNKPPRLCSSSVASWKFPAGTQISHRKVNSDNCKVAWLLRDTLPALPELLLRQQEQAPLAFALPCLAWKYRDPIFINKDNKSFSLLSPSLDACRWR